MSCAGIFKGLLVKEATSRRQGNTGRYQGMRKLMSDLMILHDASLLYKYG
ncbi:hypothetical protein Pyn_28426 [Prunus yedoensis var. nudiflora]|uniref:Uncharacterized protein n=1 Tax=Prunus yedoensis var. nudiflora TaxID=2094558 RepID=A0A314Z2V9_PRUYE|nr:hypothetical protein Pyn_28426 [Prunus yedoensis var. nudiflora]